MTGREYKLRLIWGCKIIGEFVFLLFKFCGITVKLMK